MGLIPQVKCGRCDRTYSGLRSRCPYCGAHRHKKGKRVSDGDNATWKLIIGILLIVVLIAAVIVILVTSAKEGDEGEKDDPGGTDGNPSYEPGNNPDDTGPGGSTAQIAVTGADGSAVTTLTLKVGEIVELNAAVTPDTVTDAPVWTSGDESVVKVETADETGLKVRVTGVNNGSAAVTVTAGGAKVEIAVTCGDVSTPPPTDTAGPASPSVASSLFVSSQYSKGKAVTDFTLHVGESVTCTANVTPSTATSPVTWTVDKDGGIEIVPTDDTGVKVKITCVGSSGYVNVTATIDGVQYTFKVQCRK